nr:DUF3798 domain-containing protein [uncultured Peptostreptococcus sp.]
MLKKIIISSLMLVFIVGFTGCYKNDKAHKKTVGIVGKRAEITIYIDKGSKLDPKYLKDDKIAINYLPDNKNKFDKDDINAIVNNVDKNVKVLLISTKRTGLGPAFKGIKKKIPGIITVADEMGELEGINKYILFKDKNIDIGLFRPSNSGEESVILAKEMSADNFIYIVSKEDYLSRNYTEDINLARQTAEKYGLKFSLELVEASLDNIKAKFNKMDEKTRSKTAIYSSHPKYSEFCLENALNNKFILPNINSSGDGDLIARKLSIKKLEQFESREDFDNSISRELNKRGIKHRIAGVSESRSSLSSELVIEVAKYMYEKKFNFEECYTDISLLNRSNSKLDIGLKINSIGQAYGYFRELRFLTRIY